MMALSTTTTSRCSADFWQENVPVYLSFWHSSFQFREFRLLVQFQTVRLPSNESAKEYRIWLSCDEEPQFLYKTVVTADTYERLVRYERLATAFSAFPALVQRLVRAAAAPHDATSSSSCSAVDERFVVTITSRSSAQQPPDQIEFLVSAGRGGSSKRLSLSFSLASQSELVGHLVSSLQRVTREKDSRHSKERHLEAELEVKNAKIKDWWAPKMSKNHFVSGQCEGMLHETVSTCPFQLEQVREWQQRQLEMMQNMLQSAQRIQGHYDELLQTRGSDRDAHRCSYSSSSRQKSSINRLGRCTAKADSEYDTDRGSATWSEGPSSPTAAAAVLQQETPPTVTQYGEPVDSRAEPVELAPVCRTGRADDDRPKSLKLEPTEENGIVQDAPQSAAGICVAEEDLRMDEGSCSTRHVQQLASFINTPPTIRPPFEAASTAADLRTDSSDQRQNFSVEFGVGVYFQCSSCPQQALADELSLRAHFSAEHLPIVAGTDDIVCPMESCSSAGYSFKTRESVLEHMAVFHSGRVYGCQFCGKLGRTLHCLRVHVRSHTGERPHECEICGRRFANASSHRRHKMVHTGENRYSCPICARQIARKDNVKVHLRSHFKEVSSISNGGQALF